MPQRRFKPRTRKTALRDARLIIIAAEGSKTEKRYFEDLASDSHYRNPKVHVEVLDRLESSESSPGHVIEVLNTFRGTYSLEDDDELWLVIDVDRWGDAKLKDIATQCLQKHYRLAVSNPGFEIWLLLHFTSLHEYSSEQQEAFSAKSRSGSRTTLEKELTRLVGRFNKSDLNTSDYLPFVETALDRAEQLDLHPEHRWPNQLGTRVYQLVKSILRR